MSILSAIFSSRPGYLMSVVWANSSCLALTRLARDFSRLVVRLCHADTGACVQVRAGVSRMRDM